jgi:hypothetical protein
VAAAAGWELRDVSRGDGGLSHGGAWQLGAGHGLVGPGMAWQGKAGEAWRVDEWFGGAQHGSGGTACHGKAGMAR